MAIGNVLDRLGLTLHRDVFTLEDTTNAPMVSGEIRSRLELIGPDAYFSFNSQPLILFFDLEDDIDDTREKLIHKQIWSFDNSPLAFLLKSDEIQVFNAFAFDKEKNALERIEISQEGIFERFSFWKLQSGESWEWLQANIYKVDSVKKRVNQKLFDNIKVVRQKLTNTRTSDCLTEEQANILVLRLIFARYLIDRQVKIDEEFIVGNSVLEKRKSFSQLILNTSKLSKFFSYLNGRFNGVLFKDSGVNLSSYQAKSLSFIFDSSKSSVDEITLFDGDDFYFDIFDFSIIPVEVISGIYESLIESDRKAETSAVYTPSFLVEYILTETLDKFLDANNTSESRIFDPAMGSGIFLVQSLRRMIDREKKLFGNSDMIRFSERIREIACNNLYGIDVNDQALKVACFSVYIALLDYQEPKDIDKYEFPHLLDSNFFKANFFDLEHQFNAIIYSKNVDFILGNPPWKSDSDDLHVNWISSQKKTIGRKEIAQSYLLRSEALMHSNTICSLIVTSTIFYNVTKTTKHFKREFLTNFRLLTFFDLSPVRRLVFEGQKEIKLENGKTKIEKYANPASIVIYRLAAKEEDLSNVVKHYSLKPNIFLRYFRTIVIEKHDQKEIQQRFFNENEWMFKVALYGNTLDFSFLTRLLKNKKKIGDQIDGKITFKGPGIKNSKDPVPHPELVGLPLLENRGICDFFTPVNKGVKMSEKDALLGRARKIELFLGEKILLKEQARNESQPVVSYSTEACVFRNGVFGISSVDDPEHLRCLYAYFLSDLNTYFLFMTSCAWGVGTRPAIRFVEEFLAFPFRELTLQKQTELAQLVGAFLQPLIDHNSNTFSMGSVTPNNDLLKEINAVIYDLYEVTKIEKDLMDFTLDISRYQFQVSRQDKFTKFKDRTGDLRKYSEIYVQEFALLYEGEHLWVEIYSLTYFTAINFRFSKEIPSKEEQIRFMEGGADVESVLGFLSSTLAIQNITDCKDSRNNIYVQKDIKGFEQNSFYIIKPNEYKCWHHAIAWYDVAEFREIIEDAELEWLEDQSNIYDGK